MSLASAFASALTRAGLDLDATASSFEAVGRGGNGVFALHRPSPYADAREALTANGRGETAPVVIHQDSGEMVARLVLHPGQWMKPARLAGLLACTKDAAADSMLRSQLGLPSQGLELTPFVAAPRIRLLLGRLQPTLAINILPRLRRHGAAQVTREMMEADVAELLLSRAGAVSGFFPMLRSADPCALEMGVAVDRDDPAARVAQLARELAARASSERRFIEVLLTATCQVMEKAHERIDG